jgi:hypothetical protein
MDEGVVEHRTKKNNLNNLITPHNLDCISFRYEKISSHMNVLTEIFIRLAAALMLKRIFPLVIPIGWVISLILQPGVRYLPAEPTYLISHLRLGSLLLCWDTLLVIMSHDATRGCHHHLAPNS